MGHGSSKSSSFDDSTNGHVSRRERIKKKLHLDRRKHLDRGSHHPKLNSLDDFAGIALVTIISV